MSIYNGCEDMTEEFDLDYINHRNICCINYEVLFKMMNSKNGILFDIDATGLSTAGHAKLTKKLLEANIITFSYEQAKLTGYGYRLMQEAHEID